MNGRFPLCRARPLALALPLLGLVTANCRVGYDPLSSEPVSLGGTAGGNLGGSLGSSGASGSGTQASGGDGGVSGNAGAAGDSGRGGTANGASGGMSGNAGAGGSSGGVSGNAGAGGSGGSGSCNAAAGCTCESFGAHAYWFCSTGTTRADALAVCVGGGLSLTRIDDAAENTWILDTATALGMISSTLLPSDLLYTGANDIKLNGDWQWEDSTSFWSGGPTGTPVGGLYSNWASSHPQTSSLRSCAGLFFNGKWQSRSCTAAQPYVCEAQ